MHSKGFKIPLAAIVLAALIIIAIITSLLSPGLWSLICRMLDIVMKEHPWMLGIMEVVATLFLLTVTWMHMRESRKLRLRPLYSQFINMLILPLIRAIDEYWKRKNIEWNFIKYHGLPSYRLRSYGADKKTLTWIHSGELERMILWNMFKQECSDVANIITEHDRIIAQLEQTRRELKSRLGKHQKFRNMIMETLRKHLLSHDIGPEQRDLESYVRSIINCLVLERTVNAGIDHEREYWRAYGNNLRKAFESLKMEDRDIGKLAVILEDLRERLARLPDKSTIIASLNRLAQRYAKKYGVQLQRPEWLL